MFQYRKDCPQVEESQQHLSTDDMCDAPDMHAAGPVMEYDSSFESEWLMYPGEVASLYSVTNSLEKTNGNPTALDIYMGQVLSREKPEDSMTDILFSISPLTALSEVPQEDGVFDESLHVPENVRHV